MTEELARHLEDWQPAELTEADTLPADPARALASVLQTDEPAAHLPPLWQWLYFLNWPPPAELGEDGHPAEGRFMPPIPRRRRMWAGGRVTVDHPLALEQPTRRVSSVASATVKQARSGELALVVVRQEFWQGDRLCVVEEQDHIYRDGGKDKDREPWPPRPTVQPESALEWQQPLRTDPTLLFRLSALTANSHRIHYDDEYTRGVEGYPGLVVHGPLLALQMAEVVRRECDAPVAALQYRLHRPLFVREPALVVGCRTDPGSVEVSVLSAPQTTHASCTVQLQEQASPT